MSREGAESDMRAPRAGQRSQAVAQDPAGAPPGTAAGVESAHDGRPASRLAWAAVAELGPGRPLPGHAQGFVKGPGTEEVRFHDDASASRVAAAHGADAFAVGSHVGIGSSAPRPGTLRGDLLLAHELAHAAQQARAGELASETELERDADWAAIAGVLRGGAIVGRASPFRLQLRKCFTSDAEIETFRTTLLTDLADPVANEAKIIAEIDLWGGDFEDVAPVIGPLKGGSLTGSLLTTSAGERIVAKARAVLAASGDPKAKLLVLDLDKALKAHTTATRPYGAPEAADLAKVNSAIAAETPARKALYASVSPPLDLSVKLYQPGMESAGGVYYDPYMPKTPPGSAGATTVTRGATIYGGTTYEFRRFGNYIRLGPLALGSDDYIRSSLFHEFQHYRLAREKTMGAAATDPAAKALEAMPTADETDNQEVEVIGLQMAEDVTIAKLQPLEHAANLAYLATSLASGKVVSAFRDRAFDRIVTAATTGVAGRKDLLAAFPLLPTRTTLTAPQIALLDPLKARLIALAAPPKPPVKTAPGKK